MLRWKILSTEYKVSLALVLSLPILLKNLPHSIKYEPVVSWGNFEVYLILNQNIRKISFNVIIWIIESMWFLYWLTPTLQCHVPWGINILIKTLGKLQLSEQCVYFSTLKILKFLHLLLIIKILRHLKY